MKASSYKQFVQKPRYEQQNWLYNLVRNHTTDYLLSNRLSCDEMANCTTLPNRFVDLYHNENNSITLSLEEQAVNLFLYISTILWLFGNLFIFLKYKNRFARTKLRVTTNILLYLLAVLFFMNGWILPIAIGVELLPCWFSFVFLSISLGFFNAASFLRNSCFLLMTRLSIATYKYGRIPLDLVSAEEERRAKLNFIGKFLDGGSLIFFCLKCIFRPESSQNTASREQHVQTLSTIRFVTSFEGSVQFCVLLLSPYFVLLLVLCLTLQPYLDNCYGCFPNNIVNVSVVCGLGGLLLTNAIFFVVKCRNFPDVWGVFAEGRLSARGIITAFIGMLLVSFLQIPQKYFLNIVIFVGFLFGYFVASSYQVFVAFRKDGQILGRDNSKRKTENLTHPDHAPASGHVSTTNQKSVELLSDLKGNFPRLQEILASPSLARAFEYHLSNEFGVENLSFLQDVLEWKGYFGDIAKSASLARAKKLINTYILEGGLNQLNISSEMAEELIQLRSNTSETEDGNGVLKYNMFDRAASEVAHLLETGAALRFSKTDEYRQYLSGQVLVNAISE